MTVLRGYDTVPGARCPYCGGCHMAFVDDGQEDTFQVLCWCGAKARVAKDDPDVVALVKEAKRRRASADNPPTDERKEVKPMRVDEGPESIVE